MKIRKDCLLSVVLFFLSNQAYAAPCASELDTETRVPELLECIKEMNRELESTRDFLSQVVKSTQQLAPTPRGSVIAFDDPAGCPDGWEPFRRAEGRFIIGVNDLDLKGQVTVSNLAPKFFGEVGGAENVTLRVAQMPEHSHASPSGAGIAGQGNATGVIAQGVLKVPAWVTGSAGNNESHNNMPPYIALYFCKKD